MKVIIRVDAVRFRSNTVELVMVPMIEMNIVGDEVVYSRPCGESIDAGVTECINAFATSLDAKLVGFINNTTYRFSDIVNNDLCLIDDIE